MIGLLWTMTALALLAVPALTLPSVLHIRGRAPFALAALTVASAEIVAITILLSPFHAFTRPGVLAGLAVIAAASGGVWLRMGRPFTVRLPKPGAHLDIGGAALAMVALSAVALIVQFYVGSRIAPSNWDSMTYHLSRAAYWLQQGSVSEFAGASVRQSAYPPNAEILQAWTMLMTGTDRWVEIVQWIALVGLGLLVYSGARLLRFAPSAAAFAGAAFVALPDPLMQSASTQNDLVTGFFVGGAGFFAVRGLRDHHLSDLAIAGAALGLAIGTKGTALIAVIALAVIATGAVVGYRPGARVVLAGVGFAIAGTVAFGSYGYVLDYANTHDIFGGAGRFTDLPRGADHLDNAGDVLWTLADAPGLDVAGDERVDVDTGVQEDTTAFGLMGFLALPTLVLVALLSPRSPPTRRVLAAAVIAFFGLFAYRLAFNPWLGRLMIPAVALAAPLFAMLAQREWVARIAVAVTVVMVVPCVLRNPQKPVLVRERDGSVFSWPRLQQMTVMRPELTPVFDRLTAMLARGDRVGFVGGEDSWDYPLFGAHREHVVERFSNAREVTYREMRRDRLRGVYFADQGVPPRDLTAVELAPNQYWVPAKQ